MVDLAIRIQEKRLEKGLNKSQLGVKLGISGTAIKQYEDGKNYPKTEVLLAMSKILNWDFINDKPLENQENSNSNENITYKENVNQGVRKGNHLSDNDRPSFYTALPQQDNIKRVSMQNDNLNMFVVSLKAAGGFLSGYENKVYDTTIQKVSFPLVRGECFAFEIEGFSMSPDYMPGDWFVGSRLEGFDWLVRARVYVFVTVGGIILKTFNGFNEDHALLSSINNEYNPVDPIHLKDIKGIFHKEAVIKL